MVTILFNNGARTFKSPQNDNYKMKSLIKHLESIILNVNDTFYVNVKLGNILSIATDLYNNGYQVK